MSDADTLGSELRAARENRDLTLEQAEKQTRIRAHYLEALEQGNYSALPSAVQGRGFLRNYARFLGLDPEVLVARFDAALRGGGSRRGRRAPPVFADDPTLQSVSRRTVTREQPSATRSPYRAPGQTNVTPPPERMAAVAPTPAETRRRRNRNMTLGTLAIVTISIIALVILILYSTQPNANNLISPILSPGPTQPPAIQTADAAQTAETPTKVRPTPLPNPNGSATPAVIQAGGITIQILVKARAYLRVTVDGQVVYDKPPAPNSVLTYTGKNSIQIHSGDAGGIEVTVNGIVQEPLGQPHEIVDKTYSLDDLAVPQNPPAQASPTSTTLASIGPPTNTVAAALPLSAFPQTAISTALPLAALSSTSTARLPSTTRAATNPPVQSSPSITALPSTLTTTSTVTRTPSMTRQPSITPTPSSTPTASRTPIFLPHDTITPDSRAN